MRGNLARRRCFSEKRGYLMANRKTLYKGNGTEVTFIEVSAEVKQTLVNLSKTALRESGKVVRQKLREALPTRSKRLKNHIGSWAMINYKTGQPTLRIGFYSWQRVKKRGKLPSHASPHWIEFGTKAHDIPKDGRAKKFMAYGKNAYGFQVHHPGTAATHILRNTVQNNIAEMRAAQAQYLTEISRTLEEAKAKCYSGEDVDEND